MIGKRRFRIERTSQYPRLVLNEKHQPLVWGRLDAPPALAADKLAFEYLSQPIDIFITMPETIYTVCWDGEQGFDYRIYDLHVEKLVKLKPDIGLILFVGIPNGVPYRWARRHPEELALTNRNRPIKMPSMASEIWRRDFAEALRNFVHHFETCRWADNIVGYCLHRNCNECFGYDMNRGRPDGEFADYSQPMQRYFRQWLRHRYDHDLHRFQEAWKTSDITFEEATIPDVTARVGLEARGCFNCEDSRGNRVSDWYRAYNQCNSEDLSEACRALKEALAELGTEKLVGLMHGYVDQTTSSYNGEFGHLEGCLTMRSAHIDFVHAPHTYFNRMTGQPEGNHLSRYAVANWHRHGKYVVDQFDMGTHHTPENAERGTTAPCVIQHMRRGIGNVLQTGAGLYWYNGGPGNYDNASVHGPALWSRLHFDDACYQEAIQRLTRLVNDAAITPGESRTEIALIHSTRSLADLNQRDARTVATLLNAHFRSVTMGYLGAPFDEWYLEDFESIDRPYKLYIFVTCFRIPENLRARILNKLSGSGATVLWLYGSAWFNDDGPAPDQGEALTGMKLRKFDGRNHAKAIAAHLDHPYLHGMSEEMRRWGTDIDPQLILRRWGHRARPLDLHLNSRFYLESDRAEFLAHDPDDPSLPVLGVCSHHGFTSVGLTVPLPPIQLVRNIARQAGVHIYSNAGDVIFANSRFITLFAANQGGERLLCMPQPVTLEDVFSGTSLTSSEDGTLHLQVTRGETRIYRIRQRQEP